MTVRVERAGPVTTVIMDRPGARNATLAGPGTAAGIARSRGGAGRGGAPSTS